jgi:hypothetical protein
MSTETGRRRSDDTQPANVPILFADYSNFGCKRDRYVDRYAGCIQRHYRSIHIRCESIFLYSRHRRHKAIDIITTDAQIETAHIANLQATVAEITTIDAVDINASSVDTDRIVSHTDIV